ncbi:MAG: 30S ribosomal protein S3 [Candidatus Omnitrophica bacterium]|nr:30S ribosomal protein S3 [Candidatus Omnitrophota bacterium]MCF7893498.1 30S ribosomal protein S3 [Candidatus Omnitrophota bacterium]
MGQKVHPYVLRIGFGKSWLSRWFSPKKGEYADFLEEDLAIRQKIKKSYSLGSIATIDIERVSSGGIRIKVRTSRPGVIIGRRGQDIERVKKDLSEMTGKEIIIDVEEVSDQALEGQLVAELIAFQLIKRVKFRRAMKKALQQAQSSLGEGIKVQCSGRLGGVELARSESYKYGKIPLHTFRTDIDYGFAVAKTTYGTIGVKVWVYKGQKQLGDYLVKPEKEKKR